jgi:hypothetical protein
LAAHQRSTCGHYRSTTPAAPSFLYGIPRLGQFDLLDTFGRDSERDGLAPQFITHRISPFIVDQLEGSYPFCGTPLVR